MKPKLTIKNIRQIDKLNYLNGFEIEYQNKLGKSKIWELISRQGIERLESEIYRGNVFSDGAMIFATNYERTHVVLLKEFRVSAGHYVYMLPAGLSDHNEGIETTSCREFKEETGLTFEFVSKAPPRFASVGIINERVEIAYGYYSGTPSTEYQSDDEDAEVVFVDKAMAKHILENEDVAIRTALLLENFFELNAFIHVEKADMRVAKLEDIDQMFELCQLLKDENARMSFTDVNDRSEISAWFDDPNIYLYGAFDRSGVLTGLLRARRGQGNKSHSAYLAAAVHPAFRRRNVAKELTDFALVALKEEGVKIARTYIYSWNKASIATIEKCGFTFGGRVEMHEYDPLTETYIDDLIYHKIL